MYLLTTDSVKINKGRKYGFYNVVLHLSPCREGGRGNVCPWSTPECRRHCLRTSGRMGLGAAPAARAKRTHLFFDDRPKFLTLLKGEIGRARRYARLKGLSLVVRLNGTSDIAWESIDPTLFSLFPDVTFYDYTKAFNRVLRATFHTLGWPKNYFLSYSRTEENDWDCQQILAEGGNVAVVFPRGRPLPSTWYGYPVIDGDSHDVRPTDPPGTVVGLMAKGSLRRVPAGGFVTPTLY